MAINRKTLYYKRNNGDRSRNHCSHVKPISITHSECVFVTLVIQQATRMRHIILLSVACLTTRCFHIMISHKPLDRTRVLISSTTFVRNISRPKNSARHKCKQVLIQTTRYSFQILIIFKYYRHIFEKCSDVKFHENTSN